MAITLDAHESDYMAATVRPSTVLGHCTPYTLTVHSTRSRTIRRIYGLWHADRGRIMTGEVEADAGTKV